MRALQQAAGPVPARLARPVGQPRLFRSSSSRTARVCGVAATVVLSGRAATVSEVHTWPTRLRVCTLDQLRSAVDIAACSGGSCPLAAAVTSPVPLNQHVLPWLQAMRCCPAQTSRTNSHPGQQPHQPSHCTYDQPPARQQEPASARSTATSYKQQLSVATYVSSTSQGLQRLLSL
jgi:hypothetical protein